MPDIDTDLFAKMTYAAHLLEDLPISEHAPPTAWSGPFCPPNHQTYRTTNMQRKAHRIPSAIRDQRKARAHNCFTTSVGKNYRIAIPKLSPRWRIGVRVYFKRQSDDSIRISLSPQGSWYHGKLQSARIQRDTQSAQKAIQQVSCSKVVPTKGDHHAQSI